MVPFILPQAVSFSFMRIPCRMTGVNTTVQQSTSFINTSFIQNNTLYTNVIIMTAMAGASTGSLQSILNSNVSIIAGLTLTVGGTSNNYTISRTLNWPELGTTSQSTFTSGVTSASLVNNFSGNNSNIMGSRWLDIPMVTSLSPGNYWLQIGFSSSVSTAGLPSPNSFSNGGPGVGSMAAQLKATNAWAIMGETNSYPYQVGLGRWFSGGTGAFSSSPIAISDIAIQNNPQIVFELLNIT